LLIDLDLANEVVEHVAVLVGKAAGESFKGEAEIEL
jgi:hypothetical protein